MTQQTFCPQHKALCLVETLENTISTVKNGGGGSIMLSSTRGQFSSLYPVTDFWWTAISR